MQANDTLCTKIRRYLEEGVWMTRIQSKCHYGRKKINLFTISGGLLFRIDSINSRKNHPRLKLVAPLALRRRILADTHESAFVLMAYFRTFNKVIIIHKLVIINLIIIK